MERWIVRMDAASQNINAPLSPFLKGLNHTHFNYRNNFLLRLLMSEGVLVAPGRELYRLRYRMLLRPDIDPLRASASGGFPFAISSFTGR